MNTFIKMGSVVIGLFGLAFLILQPAIGVALILIGLLLYLAIHRAEERRAFKEWQDIVLEHHQDKS